MSLPRLFMKSRESDFNDRSKLYEDNKEIVAKLQQQIASTESDLSGIMVEARLYKKRINSFTNFNSDEFSTKIRTDAIQELTEKRDYCDARTDVLKANLATMRLELKKASEAIDLHRFFIREDLKDMLNERIGNTDLNGKYKILEARHDFHADAFVLTYYCNDANQQDWSAKLMYHPEINLADNRKSGVNFANEGNNTVMESTFDTSVYKHLHTLSQAPIKKEVLEAYARPTMTT